MKAFKKTLTVVLALIMVMSIVVMPASAAGAKSFTDVTEKDWFYDSVMRWANAGVVNGKTDTTFEPNAPMKRGEFAKVMAEVLGLSGDYTSVFADKGHWSDEYVTRCYAEGIVNGSPVGDKVYFYPEQEISREQAFAMMVRALNINAGSEKVLASFTDSHEVSDWAKEENSTATLITYGAVVGNPDGSLNPKGSITRAEVVKILDRLVGVHVSKEGVVTTAAADTEQAIETGARQAGIVVVHPECKADVTVNVEIVEEEVEVTDENGETTTVIVEKQVIAVAVTDKKGITTEAQMVPTATVTQVDEKGEIVVDEKGEAVVEAAPIILVTVAPACDEPDDGETEEPKKENVVLTTETKVQITGTNSKQEIIKVEISETCAKHTYEEGNTFCLVCGECGHGVKEFVGTRDENVHYMACVGCGKTFAEAHTFKDGICSVCEYKEGECLHNYELKVDEKTHTFTCAKCGEVEKEFSGEHDYNPEGYCEICGYEPDGCLHTNVVTDVHGNKTCVDCEIILLYVEDCTPDPYTFKCIECGKCCHLIIPELTEKTHHFYCLLEDCDFDQPAQEHSFTENGWCLNCGYMPGDCLHKEYAEDAHGNYICSDCGNYLYWVDDCVDEDEDFKCDVCDRCLHVFIMMPTETEHYWLCAIPGCGETQESEEHIYNEYGRCSKCTYAPGECLHENLTTEVHGDMACKDCGERLLWLTDCTDADGDNKCDKCGECVHTNTKTDAHGNVICVDCNSTVVWKEGCDYTEENPICSICGRCIHPNITVKLTEKTHTFTCVLCGETTFEGEHQYNDNGNCVNCGYKPGDCIHKETETDKHGNVYCVDCEQTVLFVEEHTFGEDGLTCIVCGRHVHGWFPTVVDDKTHKWVCVAEDCGEERATEPHVFGEAGNCTVCGYNSSNNEPACKHESTEIRYVDMSHAKFCMLCDEEVNGTRVPCVDADKDTLCDVCGGCAQHIGYHVDLGDGTCAFKCNYCGKIDTTSVKDHVDTDNDGVCDYCQHGKTEEVPGETEHVHDYATKVETVAPTCTEKGLKTFKCACGETKTEEIVALGHTEVKVDAVAATCTKTGLTEGKKCSACNTVIKAQETVPVAAHTWDAGKVSIEAGCTKEGVKTYTCTVCETATKTEKIAALGHEWIGATCTTAKTCSSCKATEGEALGHKFGDNEPNCSVCGAENPDYKEPTVCEHENGFIYEVVDGKEHEVFCKECKEKLDNEVCINKRTEDRENCAVAGEYIVECECCGAQSGLEDKAQVHEFDENGDCVNCAMNAEDALKFELEVSSVSEGEKNFVNMTVTNDYVANITVTDGKVDASRVTLYAAMKDVASLGGGEKKHEQTFETGLTGDPELAVWLSEVFDFNAGTIEVTIEDETAIYELVGTKDEEGNAIITGTPNDVNGTRAAWAELTSHVSNGTQEASDSFIEIANGSYLVVGGEILCFEKDAEGNLKLDDFSNLSGMSEKIRNMVQAYAYEAEDNIIAYMAAGTKLAVSNSIATLNDNAYITINSVALDSGDVDVDGILSRIKNAEGGYAMATELVSLLNQVVGAANGETVYVDISFSEPVIKTEKFYFGITADNADDEGQTTVDMAVYDDYSLEINVPMNEISAANVGLEVRMTDVASLNIEGTKRHTMNVATGMDAAGDLGFWLSNAKTFKDANVYVTVEGSDQFKYELVGDQDTDFVTITGTTDTEAARAAWLALTDHVETTDNDGDSYIEILNGSALYIGNEGLVFEDGINALKLDRFNEIEELKQTIKDSVKLTKDGNGDIKVVAKAGTTLAIDETKAYLTDDVAIQISCKGEMNVDDVLSNIQAAADNNNTLVQTLFNLLNEVILAADNGDIVVNVDFETAAVETPELAPTEPPAPID